jgi:hypothetical protein
VTDLDRPFRHRSTLAHPRLLCGARVIDSPPVTSTRPNVRSVLSLAATNPPIARSYTKVGDAKALQSRLGAVRSPGRRACRCHEAYALRPWCSALEDRIGIRADVARAEISRAGRGVGTQGALNRKCE